MSGRRTEQGFQAACGARIRPWHGVAPWNCLQCIKWIMVKHKTNTKNNSLCMQATRYEHHACDVITDTMSSHRAWFPWSPWCQNFLDHLDTLKLPFKIDQMNHGKHDQEYKHISSMQATRYKTPRWVATEQGVQRVRGARNQTPQFPRPLENSEVASQIGQVNHGWTTQHEIINKSHRACKQQDINITPVT